MTSPTARRRATMIRAMRTPSNDLARGLTAASPEYAKLARAGLAKCWLRRRSKMVCAIHGIPLRRCLRHVVASGVLFFGHRAGGGDVVEEEGDGADGQE